jgi:DNA-binding response OmpR family regulator
MARSGADALKRLREIRADVIITDLHMPEMDGVTFVAEVRRTEEIRTTPVIMMTASRADQARAALEAAAVSVDRILTKPVALGELVAAIETLISREAGAGKAVAGSVTGQAPSPERIKAAPWVLRRRSVDLEGGIRLRR